MSYLPYNKSFTSPLELYRKIDEYFQKQASGEGIITMLGLRLHLDISNTTYQNYRTYDGFREVMEWADQNIEHWLEKKLLLDNKPVGAIFQLKSVHKRTDQPQVIGEQNNYVYVFGNEAKQLKRERKAEQVAIEAVAVCDELLPTPVVPDPPKRKRGRPKKIVE